MIKGIRRNIEEKSGNIYSFVSQASIFLCLDMDSHEGTEQIVECQNSCRFGKKKRSQKKDFLQDRGKVW